MTYEHFFICFCFCDARTFKKLEFLEQSELLLQHSNVVTLHLVMTTVSSSRGVFKTGSNIYNGVFSEKIAAFSRQLFLQKRIIVDV